MFIKRLRPAAPASRPETGGDGRFVPVVLDANAVSRLRELDPSGKNRLIEKIVAAFNTSVARLLPQIDEALRKGDLAGIRHVAHTLKSSSASVGALALSKICAEIESMARLGDATSMDVRVELLRVETVNAQAALNNLAEESP